MASGAADEYDVRMVLEKLRCGLFVGGFGGASPFLIVSMLFGFLTGGGILFTGQPEAGLVLLVMFLPLLIAYPITFAALLLFGLPVYALMARWGSVSPLGVGLIEALIGMALFELYKGRWDWDLLRLGMGGVTGGVAAYFWARAMARRNSSQLS